MWCYSVNKPYEEPFDVLAFYLGDQYVDIVGQDIYSDAIEDVFYKELLSTGKPFASTEYGPKMNNGRGDFSDGDWDYMNLIRKIKEQYPKTIYWLSWHDWKNNRCSLTGNKNADKVLEDPWVITRSEINW